MIRRLQLRIGLLLLFVTLLFGAGIYLITRWVKGNQEVSVSNLQKNQAIVLRHTVELQARSLRLFTTDFPFDGACFGELNLCDTSKFSLLFNGTLSNFGVNQVRVYDKKFNTLYLAQNRDLGNVENTFPTKEKLQLLVRETRYPHFFLNTSKGVMEVSGAPVQLGTDTTDQTELHGWLFACSLWSDQYLGHLALITSGRLLMDTSFSINTVADQLRDRTDSLMVSFPLEGWSGRPVAFLRFLSPVPFVNEFNQYYQWLLWASFAFLLVALSIILFFMFRFVDTPLKLLNKTLVLRDIKYLKPFENQSGLFGKVSENLTRLFDQEAVLIETQRRRKVESDLLRTEQRYRLLVENNPDVLWIANDLGDTIYVSPNITHVLGYAPEDIVCNNDFWVEAVHESDYPMVRRKYSDYIHSDRHFESEYRIKHKDGHYVWISEKAISKFEMEGDHYSCGRISDITMQISMESKLLDSEQEFRALFEQNPLGVILIDLKTNLFIKANKVFCQMLGYSEVKLLELSLKDLTLPLDFEKEMQITQTLLDGIDEKVQHEQRLLRNDGTLIWIHLTFSCVKNHEGKVLFGLGIVEDITSRKSDQEMFEYEHTLLTSLIEFIPDAIVFKDSMGKYINVNPAGRIFCDNIGIGDPVGKLDYELFSNQEQMLKLVQEDNTLVSARKPIVNKEFSVVSVENETLWFSETQIPIYIPSRHEIIHIIINRDITELKSNELTLSRVAQELNASNIAKDTFLSILAHDLKNPFNAILGFATILLEEYDEYSEKERRHFIYNIHQAADTTFSLIQNVLEWSRSQTGRIHYLPEQIQLDELFSDTYKLLRISINSKNINYESSIKKETSIYADPNMMRTIIRNLLSNAIKFTPEGGSISVSTRSVNKGMLEVMIKDSGIGIPEQVVSQLFKSNEYFGRSGTRGEQGTGLGLVLCKDFLERQGGLIWVQSKEGEGSTFHFTIPEKSPETGNHDDMVLTEEDVT